MSMVFLRNFQKIGLLLCVLTGVLGSACLAWARNYNIKNDSGSFLFVNGTTGNVGIGTVEPAALLHVGGGGAVPNAMSITGNDLYVKGNIELDGKIYGDGSQLTIVAPGTGWTIGSGLVHTTTSTDNVGIGSANPSQKLDVAGTARASQIMDSGLGSGTITYAGTSGLLTGDAHFVFDTVNVGIGSTLPMARLNVVDPNDPAMIERSGLGTNALATALRILATKTSSMNSGFGVTLDFTGRNTGAMNNLAQAGAVWSGADDSGDLVVATSTSGTLSEKMRVTRYGNVGIGTSLPRAYLQVGSGASTLALGANDALLRGRLEVDGTAYFNGNVGIATSAPDALLQVSGTGATSIYLDSLDSDVALGLRSFAASGGIWYMGTGLASAGNTNNYYIKDASGGGSSMRCVINTSGNVGIGTITPAAKLHVGSTPSAGLADLSANSLLVKGNLEVDGKIYADGSLLTNIGWITATGKMYTFNATDNVGLGTTAPLARLEMKGAGATSATSSLMIRDSAGNVKMKLQDDGNLGIGTTAPVAMLDVNQKLTVLSNGNVGIGTTDPKFALDAYVPSADATLSRIGLDIPTGSTPYYPKVRFGLNAGFIGYNYITEAMIYNVRTNGYYEFDIAGVSQVFINSSGNLGIGTSVPTSALGVAGGVAIGNTYASARTAPTNGMIILGNVGIGTTAPASSLDVGSLRIRNSKTPSTSGDTCSAGEIAWDSSYIYVCKATNSWIRIPLSTW